jgi:Arc/MetJ-type ribon-helix-helix transcriptional regulator
MEQVAVRLPKPMLVMIDKMRVAGLDRLDRAVVIRRLIAEALQARGKREKH